MHVCIRSKGQVRTGYSGGHRLGVLIGQNALWDWPEYRKSQFFLSRFKHRMVGAGSVSLS